MNINELIAINNLTFHIRQSTNTHTELLAKNNLICFVLTIQQNKITQYYQVINKSKIDQTTLIRLIENFYQNEIISISISNT